MRFPYIIGGVGVLLVFLYGAFLIWITWPIDSLTIANAGVFGDSFGVLTSLFSALAFLGVVLTLHSQREESNLQKEELIENRKEMAKQGFESSFFQMLKLHNEIVNGFVLKKHSVGGTEVKEGRVVFSHLMISLIWLFKSKSIDIDSKEEDINQVFDIFYEQNDHQLAHYFRFLFNIFKFVSESGLDNKNFYAKLVRAQLSNQELFILYYNALNERGKNFRRYMVEFQLMDNLSSDELFLNKHRYLIPNAGFKS